MLEALKVLTCLYKLVILRKRTSQILQFFSEKVLISCVLFVEAMCQNNFNILNHS